MRVSVVVVSLLGLAACAQQVPDSAAGVGFQDYNSYLRDRAGTGAAAPAATPGFSPDVAAAAIDRAEGGPTPVAPIVQPAPRTQPAVKVGSLPADRPRGDAPAGIKVESGEMAGIPGGVSDEQDFAAVSSRETIASDKARIEANRAQYTVIQPGALPQRQGDAGPNIVDFALATNNAPGTQLYSRSKLRIGNSDTACIRYTSPDLAQEAFLAAGGPDRDRKGLDPDGDGFACAWDPRPFRNALQ